MKIVTRQQMYTPLEVAALLSCSRRTVYNLIASGQLESVKIGQLRRVPFEAVDSFLASLRDKAAS